MTGTESSEKIKKNPTSDKGKETMDALEDSWYALCLDDPATPSFVSFQKQYIGNRNALMRVAENLSTNREYTETADGIRAFFEGRTDATHTIAFQKIPVLRCVRVVDKTEMQLEEWGWDHINVWGCPYHMHFRSAKVSQLLFQLDGLFQRYIRAEFVDLGYLGMNAEWRLIGELIFGNGSVLESQNRPGGSSFFNNILYVFEDASESFDEQHQKMRNPDTLIFDRICGEVFGDG